MFHQWYVYFITITINLESAVFGFFTFLMKEDIWK